MLLNYQQQLLQRDVIGICLKGVQLQLLQIFLQNTWLLNVTVVCLHIAQVLISLNVWQLMDLALLTVNKIGLAMLLHLVHLLKIVVWLFLPEQEVHLVFQLVG